jgi:hypothetical protein
MACRFPLARCLPVVYHLPSKDHVMENTVDLASMRFSRAFCQNIDNRPCFDNKLCTGCNNRSGSIAAHLARHIPASDPVVIKTMKEANTSSICFSCEHGNSIVSGKNSSFLQCRKHFADPSYPKYPLLPVFSCKGYQGSP